MERLRPLLWFYIWFWTLLGSLVAATAVFTLGLILAFFVLLPLALFISTLVASLIASWVSNLVIKDGRFAPPARVFSLTAVMAAILALVLSLAYALEWLPAPAIFISAGSALVLATTATLAAWGLRHPLPEPPGEYRRLGAWLIITLLAVPLVIFLASLVGWAGA